MNVSLLIKKNFLFKVHSGRGRIFSESQGSQKVDENELSMTRTKFNLAKKPYKDNSMGK